MVLSKHDIVFYRSGDNGDGLGGAMHTDTVSPFSIHNVFNLVSGIERISGKTKYRCVYMKNKHISETAINPRIFIPIDTVSPTTTLFVGFDTEAGVGDGTSSGIAQRIDNEAIAPPGVKRFTNATDPSKGIALGIDIPPGKTVAVWLKLIVFLNTAAAKIDGCKVKFRLGNLLPQRAGPSHGTIIAVTGETDSFLPFSTVMSRIKIRDGINSFVSTGNTTSTTDPSAWINILGTFRDKTAIAFGPEDGKNDTMKNQLITSLSTDTNVKSLGYSFQRINNVYMIFMDMTQVWTNPSPQYDFIKSQLELAKATAGIDFIIVFCNKAFYMTLASNDANLKIDNTLRTTYHKLFTDNGVHVVISGQTRNYQRHHVLGFNATSPNIPAVFFTGQAPSYEISPGQKNFGATGCLFLNVGTGGGKPLHTPVSPKNNHTIIADGLQNTSSVGYLMLKSVQRTALRGPTLLGLFFEFYLPEGKSIPVEIQRDHWAITIL